MQNLILQNRIEPAVSVLIPDGESHLLSFVVNCLSSVKGVNIYVMSSIKWNALRFSRFVKGFDYYPETNDDTLWISNIEATATKYKVDVIMPIFETGIRRMINNRTLMSSEMNLVALTDLSTFDKAINKWELVQHAIANDISAPDSVLLQPGEPVNMAEMSYPKIIKPLEGFGGGMGVEVIKDAESLKQRLQSVTYPLLVQDYIKGYDIDCSLLAKEGKVLAYTIQQGNLPGSGPFVPHVGLAFKENDELFKVVEDLIKSLQWDGVAHLDMRYDEVLDRYVIIEINPRYWATLDGSCLVGVNFPYLALLESKGQLFGMPTYQYENYLNLKGVVKKIKNNPLFIFNWKFLYQNTQFRFVLLDPLPTAFKFVVRTKNIIVKKIKKLVG